MTSLLGNESSEVDFMNFEPYVFHVDYVAKIRSGLSITVLEKKIPQNYRLKKSDLRSGFPKILLELCPRFTGGKRMKVKMWR